MTTLPLALVQLAATTDPARNRERLAIVEDAAARTPGGLVVLPEATACDFGSPDSDLAVSAEGLDGPFVHRLVDLAAGHDVTIVAGMFEHSDDPKRPYNTLVVVDRTGLRASYRKIHLYDSFGYRESDRLLAGGPAPVLVDIHGLRVGLMTCYDLRFPELARELVRRGAELLVAPAAWVAGPRKVDHWRTLVLARAIENTVYVAAAGQPAPRYTGHSMVVAPLGDVLTELGGDGDSIATAVLDTETLAAARAENPSLLNRRL